MRNVKKCIVVFMSVMIIFVSSATECKASYDNTIFDDPKILVLMSYNYDWASVPLQLSGIKQVINGYVDADYVFMDTKNRDYEEIKDDIYKQIADYEEEGRYDYIIAADDAALHFVQEFREELFYEVPVVFEGINDESFAKEAARDPLTTGIIEAFPLEETIQMALEIQPNAKKIVAISDDTVSGKGSTQQFYDCKNTIPNLEYCVLDTSAMTSDEIKNQVSQYTEDTILIFLMMSKSVERNGYSNSEVAEFISANANIPVYKADELGIGEGIFGGVVVSYKEMAMQAAQIVMDLSNGEKIENYPLQTAQTYTSVDKLELDKFGFSKKEMPKDTIYMNDPPGFLESNYKILIVSSSIIFLLLCCIFLLKNGEKRRKEEYKKLMGLQSRLEVEKKSNLAKTDFLSRMSHDMRTPMNGILGLVELMKDENLPSQIHDSLIQIELSGKYLLNLINDTLDVNKIEKNQLELHPITIKADNVLKNILASADILAKERNIDFQIIEKDSEESTTTVLYIDEARTEQLFMNLISNAIKYTPEGGQVKVTVECLERTEKYIYNKYEIIDNGMGMSKDFLEHIYEPFSQEGRLQMNRENGTGLGMVIVHQLVKLMQADLQVESELNVGTKFTLCIRFERYQENAMEEADKEKKKISLAGKHILLCEDHPLNQQIAVKLLEKKGMLVDTAENGEVGVHLFEQSKPAYYSAILMDIRMPVMDGLEATRQIRNLEKEDATSIPIIAMTANAFDEDIAHCLEAGMNAHLGKPIEVDKMYEVLSDWMK